MIHLVDQSLTAWLKDVTGDAPVDWCSPVDAKVEQTPKVSVYLLALLPPAVSSDQTRYVPVKFMARYLLTVWAQQDRDGHELLGRVAVAAVEQIQWNTDIRGLEPSLWAGFSIAPRPGILLDIPVIVEPRQTESRLIEYPLRLVASETRPLAGRVLGAHNVPVANARITLKNHRLSTRSDDRGRFVFELVPMQPSKKQVIVDSKARQYVLQINLAKDRGDALEIHLNSAEG